ncbi:F-box/kelch-repeat protein At1g57790 [Elaeis guineensis]|uniref:F-box/kelch-repeat protein At1g57790 n=1 Tax=Elaeis guineensis var. tenera TaxID=51953 RepID=A0A6I9QYC4_ELAGV|nr:F-box/kelch-repeat protein At1g57790 [Elaeis guineensis]
MIAERHELSLPPSLGSNPWIILPHGRHKQLQTFINVSDGIVQHRSIPEMQGKRCLGSFYGWLLMWDEPSKECFLLSLTSLSKILLPPLLELAEFLDISIVSSSPALPNCMIVFLRKKQPFLFFCHVGDKEWTRLTVNFSHDFFVYSIVNCQGKLYALTFEENIMLIDTTSSSMNVEIMEVESFTSLHSYPSYFPNLVEACGDIFLVLRYSRSWGGGHVVTVDVHKLDFSKLRWERVESIGDRAFFLSGAFGISLSATESGVQPNHIYFIQPCNDAERLYIFSLDERVISFDMPCPNIRRTWDYLWWTMATT